MRRRGDQGKTIEHALFLYRLKAKSRPGSSGMLRAFRDPVGRDTDVHNERFDRRVAQQLNVMDPRPRWLLLALACSCLPHGELFVIMSSLYNGIIYHPGC